MDQMKDPTVKSFVCAKWIHSQLDRGVTLRSCDTCEWVHCRFGAFSLRSYINEFATGFVGVNGDEFKHSGP